MLHELGFTRDWIEKCLAQEEGRSARSIGNNPEYTGQRGHMLQEWADTVDVWTDEPPNVPELLPERLAAPVHVVLVMARERSYRQRTGGLARK